MNKEIGYQRDLSGAYMLIPAGTGRGDFRRRMLLENQIPHIVSVSQGTGMDRGMYRYQISSRISLEEYLQHSPLRLPVCKQLVYALCKTLKGLGEYLLTEESLLILPETIYMEKPGQYGQRAAGRISGDASAGVRGDTLENVPGNTLESVISSKSGSTRRSVSGGVSGSVLRDVSGGVPGGVSGGVPGAISGGISGGASGDGSGEPLGEPLGGTSGEEEWDFFFCLYPDEVQDTRTALKELLKYLMEKTDPTERAENSCALLLYEWYQRTLKENFCADELLQVMEERYQSTRTGNSREDGAAGDPMPGVRTDVKRRRTAGRQGLNVTRSDKCRWWRIRKPLWAEDRRLMKLSL